MSGLNRYESRTPSEGPPGFTPRAGSEGTPIPSVRDAAPWLAAGAPDPTLEVRAAELPDVPASAGRSGTAVRRLAVVAFVLVAGTLVGVGLTKARVAVLPGSLQAGPLELPRLSAATQLKFLNAQRAANGIPGDLVEVPEWSAGCAKHMAYLEQNGLFQHEEDQAGHPAGYSEEGDQAGRTSVLTTAGSAFTPDGHNEFEHAPLHLAQMLSPWTTRSGAADGCLSTIRDLGRRFSTSTTYTYPKDGGKTFSRETAREEPFVPGKFVGLPEGTETGPHLYFFYGSPVGYFGALGRIQSAELTGPDGKVEVRTVDNHTEEMGHGIPPGGIVIPVKPLKKGATYTASVRFQPDQAPVVLKSWSFTITHDCPPPGPTC